MSRDRDKKASADGDPSSKGPPSEARVDGGRNQQANQMMGLDPKATIQNHASGSENPQTGQVEGLDGGIFDQRPRTHRALVMGVPVYDHKVAHADIYELDKIPSVSIDSRQGDDKWERKPVHEVTADYNLMKEDQGEFTYHDRLGVETSMRTGAVAGPELALPQLIAFSDGKWNAIRVSVQLRPQLGDSWSDESFVIYLTHRDEGHRDKKIAETGGFDSTGALTAGVLGQAMKENGLEGGPAVGLDQYTAAQDAADKERILPVEVIWSPDVGDPMPLRVYVAEDRGDGTSRIRVYDGSGVVRNQAGYPCGKGYQEFTLQAWLQHAAEYYPAGLLQYRVPGFDALPRATQKQLGGSSLTVQANGEAVAARDHAQASLVDGMLTDADMALGTLPVAGEVWDGMNAAAAYATGHNMLGQQESARMASIRAAAVLVPFAAGAAVKYVDRLQGAGRRVMKAQNELSMAIERGVIKDAAGVQAYVGHVLRMPADRIPGLENFVQRIAPAFEGKMEIGPLKNAVDDFVGNLKVKTNLNRAERISSTAPKEGAKQGDEAVQAIAHQDDRVVDDVVEEAVDDAKTLDPEDVRKQALDDFDAAMKADPPYAGLYRDAPEGAEQASTQLRGKSGFLDRYADGWRYATDRRVWFKTGSDKVRVAEDATFEQVWEQLLEQGSPSRAYFDALSGTGISSEPLIRTVVGQTRYQGRFLSDVRRDVRHDLDKLVLHQLSDAGYLQRARPDLDWANDMQGAMRQASHAQMLEVSGKLVPGDKGRVAELWYQQNFVPDGARHMHLKAETINKGIPNAADQLKKDRFPDLIDPGQRSLVEVKNVQGKLSERELGDLSKLLEGDSQLADHMRMVGRESPGLKPGEAIEKVEYVFVNPKGGAANLGPLLEMIKEQDLDKLTVKLFGPDGKSRTYSLRTVSALDDEGVEALVQKESAWLLSR